ncbi:MAG: hypothetical protein ACRD4F_04005, partial [Candidatus Angelobacter sp.]
LIVATPARAGAGFCDSLMQEHACSKRLVSKAPAIESRHLIGKRRLGRPNHRLSRNVPFRGRTHLLPRARTFACGEAEAKDRR